MIRHPEVRLYAVKYAFIGLILLTSLPFLSLLPPVSAKSYNQTSHSEPATGSSMTYDSPNLITTGLADGTEQATAAFNAAQNNLKQNAHEKSVKLYNGLRGIGFASIRTTYLLGSTIRTAGSAIGSITSKCLSFMGRNFMTNVRFARNISGSASRAVKNVSSFNQFIRPADATSPPVIETLETSGGQSHNQQAVSPPLPAHAQPSLATGMHWPIQGRITTHFGVPHRPFQPTHTGLDISSGRASGVTAVKPFRPGVVSETIYSRYGLGNHVIVDHGNGLSSAYAHLNSISVTKNDAVGIDTTLGYEGTTGLSTGTHLHFEVRLNGKAVNPQTYLTNIP